MDANNQLFDIETMRRLSVMDMCLVYDALSRCIDVTFDADNQPRAWVNGKPSRGGKVVNLLQGYLIDARNELIKIAREMPAGDGLEIELKAWMLLKYECECTTDGLLPALGVITKALQDQQSAKEAAFTQRALAAAS